MLSLKCQIAAIVWDKVNDLTVEVKMRLIDYCERGNDKAKQGDIMGLRVVFQCAHIKAICRNDAPRCII